MSDRELRELERRYRAEGDAATREVLIRTQLRAGLISDEALRLAQHLGDPLAVEVLGPAPEPPPTNWLHRAARSLTDRFDYPGIPASALELGRWVRALEPHGHRALAEAARCALSAARLSWVALDTSWDALRAAERTAEPALAAERASACAQAAAVAVGTEPVRQAIVSGLTDWALGLPHHPPAPAPLLPGTPDGLAEPMAKLVDHTLQHLWRQGIREFQVHRSEGLSPHVALHARRREPYLVRLLFLAGLDPIRDAQPGVSASFRWTPRTPPPAQLELTLHMRSADVAEVSFPE